MAHSRRAPAAPLLGAPLLLALAGCPMPTTGIAQAQQQAQEFNLDARFGRSELVMSHVAPAERDEYSLHHKAWGQDVRVADVEIAGMKARCDKDVDIVVRVAWYRPDQQELRSTTLQQAWHAKTDGWELAGEKRLDGDIGLLGEAVVYQAPSEPRPPSQFPTIRIGGAEPATE
jgi:hypothetical protein